MKALILIVSLIILQAQKGCEDQHQEDAVKYEALEGKWEWVKTTGGFAGLTTTPASTGKKIYIEFTAEHIYKKYENQSLTSEETCRLIFKNSIYSEEETPQLSFGDDKMNQTIVLKGKELILREECHDCYEHIYRKVD